VTPPFCWLDLPAHSIGGVSGLFLAGPPGAIIGVIIGEVYGRPFWGPHSPYACWNDERFHRHCPSMFNAGAKDYLLGKSGAQR
jgi:hypothetical protein